MEKPLDNVYQTLQKLVGLHRKLLEAVRVEREALKQADINAIQSVSALKHSLIEEMHQVEKQRVSQVAELGLFWQKPVQDLSLSKLAIAIQGTDPKGAEQLRTVFSVLTLLIQRITDQNLDNLSMVEKSLEHIGNMKRNILGSAANPNTYTPQGQRANSAPASRLLSKEG